MPSAACLRTVFAFISAGEAGTAQHVTDLPMRDIVDLMLTVKCQAYSFEAANARHEHEWSVWRDVKLPDDRLRLPGWSASSAQMGSSIRIWSLSASFVSQTSLAANVSSPRPIAASADVSIRKLRGLSLKRWRRGQRLPVGSCGHDRCLRSRSAHGLCTSGARTIRPRLRQGPRSAEADETGTDDIGVSFGAMVSTRVRDRPSVCRRLRRYQPPAPTTPPRRFPAR